MARDERLGWIRDGLDLRRAHAPLSQPADRLAPTPDSAHADGGGSRCLDRHQRAPLPAGDARMGRGRGAAGRLPPPGEFPSRRGNSDVRVDPGRRADHPAHLDGVPSEHHVRYLYLRARRIDRPPDAQAAVRVPRSPWRYTGRLPGRRPAGRRAPLAVGSGAHRPRQQRARHRAGAPGPHHHQPGQRDDGVRMVVVVPPGAREKTRHG